MKIITSILSILIFNSLVNAFDNYDEYKLEQLQITWRSFANAGRHLRRRSSYIEIHKSYGYGQLTTVGKKREYKIGQLLRKRYDAFLGEYRINDVYAYSSDIDRTKMSLQLVLAGLYPPTPSTSWNDSVNWQPIPTHYDALDTSFLTVGYVYRKYQELYKKLANTTEMLEIFASHQDLLEKITSNTKVNISQLFTVAHIHSNLRSVLSLGLPLPSWCSKQDFDEIEKLAAISFKAMTYTEPLRRTLAGPVVKRMLKTLKLNDDPIKIYLYGGHDINVAAFIHAHNITGAPIFQDYGSTIILEKLRGPDERHYVRVYLWTGVTEELILLKIDNCEKICPLSDYERIVQTVLPNEKLKVCSSSMGACSRDGDRNQPRK